MTITVKDYMTPNPMTVSPETGTKTAFLMIKDQGFKQLPVVKDGKLIGIVTDRDLRRPKLSDEFESWDQLYRLDDFFTVGEIMTHNITTIRESAPLKEAALIFKEKKFNALPVLSEKGGLVGIITVHDVLNALVDLLGLK